MNGGGKTPGRSSSNGKEKAYFERKVQNLEQQVSDAESWVLNAVPAHLQRDFSHSVGSAGAGGRNGRVVGSFAASTRSDSSRGDRASGSYRGDRDGDVDVDDRGFMT